MDEREISQLADAALQINSLCDITRTYSDAFDSDEMLRINLLIEKIQEQNERIITLFKEKKFIP